jgi:hypothetical protein
LTLRGGNVEMLILELLGGLVVAVTIGVGIRSALEWWHERRSVDEIEREVEELEDELDKHRRREK